MIIEKENSSNPFQEEFMELRDAINKGRIGIMKYSLSSVTPSKDQNRRNFDIELLYVLFMLRKKHGINRLVERGHMTTKAERKAVAKRFNKALDEYVSVMLDKGMKE